MIRVLQINAVYGHGSTGTIVRDIEQLCLQNGIECYVASPDKTVLKAKNGYVIGNVVDHKLHALLCRIHGKQAYFSWLATKRFLHYIDTIKPDIVHLHNLHSNYIHLNLLLKHLAKRNIKTTVTLHDCWYFTGGCFHYTSVNCDKWKQTCRCGDCPKKFCDTPAYLKDCSTAILKDRFSYFTAIPRLTIIGASEWVAEECRQSVLKNCDIRYIHNGFDLDIFRPTSSDLRKELSLEGKYVILAPASKWYSATNKDTLEYFVNHLEPDMAIVFFGCDKPKQDIERGIREIGFIYDPFKMASLYSMADIFVNCTREDTLSSLNLESQACGTPVVTYDATGCKETVDGKCGKSVKSGDHLALYNAMIEMRTIGKKNLTEQIIKRIKDEFEINNSYKKYIQLYNE